MTDYYSVLCRAIASLDPNGKQARYDVYVRARETLSEQLRSIDPPPPAAKISAEISALNAAIRRLELEMSPRRVPSAQAPPDEFREPREAMDSASESDPPTPRTGAAFSPAIVGGLFAAALLIFGVGGYAYWTWHGRQVSSSKGGSDIRNVTNNGTPAPTVDVGVRDDGSRKPAGRPAAANVPYYVMRQVVYYRTTYPVGTIIIAKSQNFLYLTRPNTAALRYSIEVGPNCLAAVGLLLVTHKEELPADRSTAAKNEQLRPPDQIASSRGAPVLNLGDTNYRIQGAAPTNATGETASSTCFQLGNDDIMDLYDRVPLGTRVVVVN
jgi:lipoprotein-anchoring transpeptidase ErfK/SrfK